MRYLHLPTATSNQRALSPLSAGDDSGGGFPAGEEPAHASLQGECPAVLRGTQVTEKVFRIFLSNRNFQRYLNVFLLPRTLSENKAGVCSTRRKDADPDQMQTICESVDGRPVFAIFDVLIRIRIQIRTTGLLIWTRMKEGFQKLISDSTDPEHR
jgi:hypothetical protein